MFLIVLGCIIAYSVVGSSIAIIWLEITEQELDKPFEAPSTMMAIALLWPILPLLFGVQKLALRYKGSKRP